MRWDCGPKKSLGPGWRKRNVGEHGVGESLGHWEIPSPVPFSSYSPRRVKPELAYLLVNLNLTSQPHQAALPICAQTTLAPGLQPGFA